MDAHREGRRSGLREPMGLLVFGLVVLVVMVTWLLIANARSKPSATPKHRGVPLPPAVSCLYPSSLRSVSTALAAPAVRPVHPTAPADARLLRSRERAVRRFSPHLVAWSPNDHAFLVLRRHYLVVHRVGSRKASRLHLGVVIAVGFNWNGTALVFQVAPGGKPLSCATTVLMSVGLNGRHRRLLFGGAGYRLPGELAGTDFNVALSQDVLLNGWVVLMRAHRLYAFDTRHGLLAPLGRLAVRQPPAELQVSPDGRYLALSDQPAQPGVLIASLPDDITRYRVGARFPYYWWSPRGDRLAYSTVSRPGYGALRVLDVRSGRRLLLLPPQTSATRLVVTDVSWSPDGTHLVMGTHLAGCTGPGCSGPSFIASVTNQSVRLLHRKQPTV